MVSIIGRSTTTLLLALSTRRNLFLSASTFASLAVSVSPFTAAAVTSPSSRYKSTLCLCTADETTSASSSSSCAAAPLSTDTNTQRTMTNDLNTGYLSAADAAALDAELMSTPGFCLEQLMELAGLAVAEAVYNVVVGDAGTTTTGEEKKKHVLLVCGPGNNGGDGLVAARHLVHFGLAATIVYPKHSTKPHFINLVKQCEDLGIPILDTIPMEVSEERFDGIVDAIFGFSFSGIPREPYATAIANMIELQQQHKSILISVDVPSGWDVNHGGDDSTNEFKLQSLRPDVLISLTVPKLFAKYFHGRHFIGGRFLPPAMAEKYGIRKTKSKVQAATSESEDWAAQYQAYLEEKEVASEVNRDHIDLSNTADVSETEEESWTVQYAKYCEEKERDLFG
ncbi:hypothetical protein ACHAWU_009599 [Discostella pseudostelligera]|uniref:NAD(P)H-hydrate epimerase n=1 Tax=Discostella pseudostelligera TaxID=259834 RepID=A0ABD3MK56_9STRA